MFLIQQINHLTDNFPQKMLNNEALSYEQRLNSAGKLILTR